MLKLSDKKPDLPKGFSWPVKTSELSELLKGIPQFEQLTLLYSDRPLAYQLTMLKIFNFKLDYPILKSQYSISGSYGTAGGKRKGEKPPKWKLYVYPVESNSRVFVHEQILNIAIPQICNWFSQPKTQNWLESTKNLSIIFSQEKNELKAIEHGKS